MVPTRELASQVYSVVKCFSENVPVAWPTLLIGGTGIHASIQALGSHPAPCIAVATPGRLQDLLCNHGMPFLTLILFLFFCLTSFSCCCTSSRRSARHK